MMFPRGETKVTLSLYLFLVAAAGEQVSEKGHPNPKGKIISSPTPWVPFALYFIYLFIYLFYLLLQPSLNLQQFHVHGSTTPLSRCGSGFCYVLCPVTHGDLSWGIHTHYCLAVFIRKHSPQSHRINIPIELGYPKSTSSPCRNINRMRSGTPAVDRCGVWDPPSSSSSSGCFP